MQFSGIERVTTLQLNHTLVSEIAVKRGVNRYIRVYGSEEFK